MPKFDIEVNGHKITVEGDATVRILPNGTVEVTAPEVKEAPEKPKPDLRDQLEVARKIADELRKMKERHPDPPDPWPISPVYPELPWLRCPRSRPIWISDPNWMEWDHRS